MMPFEGAIAETSLRATSLAFTTLTESSTDTNVVKSPDRIAKTHDFAVVQREVEKTDDHSARDLAAQEAMAKWARFSFFIALVSAIVSGLGLLALLYSLLLNRKATAAAQSAVAVARETNESQSRAWVSATCVLEQPKVGETHAGIEGIYFNVICHAKNHGRSPATGVSFHAEMALVGIDTPSPEELMRKYCDEIRGWADGDADAIFPETNATFGHMVFLSFENIQANIALKEFKSVTPVVYGCLNYKSIYTKGVRQTRFVYHVVTINQEGQPMVLLPDQPGWLLQQIVLLRPGTLTTD
ncbi:MAG: hypothetical protein WC426_03640 [Sulfuriferula sp.]